jgi:lysophospholipase L1-like esterase/tetratricopeptide (TPR) repeat protein
MGAEGSKRQRLAAAGLSLAVLLALLGVLEAGLRLTGHGAPPLPSPFSGEGALGTDASGADPDDELFYRLRPGTHLFDYYRVNDLGCRGPDVPARRAARTLRVVCTGDSSTFGLGVPEDRAWPFVLQRLLEAALGDLVAVEVIDAGVPGYTSLQNRVQIERDLLALRPDVVVWMATGHNDGSLVLGPTDAETLAYRRSLRFRLSRWALPHALGVVGDTRTPADADTLHPAPGAPGRGRPRVSPEDFEANLRAVAAACADAGVPLVLIVPHHSEVIRAQRPDEVAAEEIVLRVARELKLGFADVRPDLGALEPRPLYPDTVHPSADGHAVLGWRVFEALAWNDEIAWPPERLGFLRAWVDSHRLGLGQESLRSLLLDDDAPPRFRQALQSLRAGSRDEPADVLAHEPLRGARRAPYGLGRELLLSAQGDPAAGAETLALLREHVTPADDLTLLLFEPASREAAAGAGDADTVAVARAIAAFDALLGAHPAPADRRLWEAQRLVAEDPAAAIALVEEVLALNPRCAEAFEVRGLALERQGDRSGAQEAFALGAQLEPDSATGSFLLGRTLLQRGETQAAEASLRRALQLDPAHKLARLALVLTLLRLHQPDAAEQQLRALQHVGAADVADVPALQAAIEAERRAVAPAPDG